MIEFLFIMFKSYLNFIIFLICKLFYINHNYKVIEILPPWTDDFVNNGRYYDFNIIYTPLSLNHPYCYHNILIYHMYYFKSLYTQVL